MPRAPQDHKPKSTSTANTEFEFEHDGETFALAPAENKFNVGWARRNRNKSELDVLFLMIEALADDDALAAIDDMNRDEFTEFQKSFQEHYGAKPGESSASSSS